MHRFSWWAGRTKGLTSGHAVPAPLPALQDSSIVKQRISLERNSEESKEDRPLFICFGPGGRPHSSLPSPSKRGGRRADRAHCPDYSGRVVRIAPDDGRETSRPAPCGAPTRHLGLYAFDRGRTGPTPSGRRGCPSTARGRGCVSHRSQVPLPFPACKTPPEGAPRRVDRDGFNIDMLLVKSSNISFW